MNPSKTDAAHSERWIWADKQISLREGSEKDKRTDSEIASDLVAWDQRCPLHDAEGLITEVKADRAKRGQEPKPKVTPRRGHLATVTDFAGEEEEGAAALLGDEDNALIAEDSDAVVYGNGGAGKTTLTTDLAFHLAAGDEWLGIPVARPVRVLLIENEGPRPLFRKKLRAKLDVWAGMPLEDRVRVFDDPWGEFTFADEGWRNALAAEIREQEIDVLVAGPVTRLGMDEAGTLQQVRDFMKLVDDVRRKSGLRLTVLLVHHQNKAGTVSGAWEGSGDTLIHVEARGPGNTALHIEKARWSSEHHGVKLDLAWAAGEGFTVKDERDYAAEIERLLGDGKLRSPEEIRKPRENDPPGIGASRRTVEDTLELRGDLFLARRGSEIGRSAKGTFYGSKKLLV